MLWDRRCGDKICDQGVCAIDLVHVPKSQARGDCIQVMCDPSGITYSVPASNDPDDDGDPCIVDYCNGMRPEFRMVPKGPAPDGSGFCDGDGHLVECAETSDCNNSSLMCSAHFKCVPPHCDNLEHDPSLGESDVDCGGPCDPCRRGYACNHDEDCTMLSCGPDHACMRATCDDGKKNGDEADIDCGFYACDVRCAEGARCTIDADCTTSSCFGGTCLPRTCDDGKRNGDEDNIDCGGSDCPPCR
ncbi:hypothetical protein ACMHYB_46350 [Sorangium sp. So ce1128]